MMSMQFESMLEYMASTNCNPNFKLQASICDLRIFYFSNPA